MVAKGSAANLQRHIYVRLCSSAKKLSEAAENGKFLPKKGNQMKTNSQSLFTKRQRKYLVNVSFLMNKHRELLRAKSVSEKSFVYEAFSFG